MLGLNFETIDDSELCSSCNGYRRFYSPEHPLADVAGLVYLHRYNMSRKLGRWLSPDENVHHIDSDRTNNSLDNLRVLSKSEHFNLHHHPNGVCEKLKNLCHVCGAETYNGDFCSNKCCAIARRKVTWPTKHMLKTDIEQLHNWCAIGRKYGVSDNAVRKWAKHYKLKRS